MKTIKKQKYIFIPIVLVVVIVIVMNLNSRENGTGNFFNPERPEAEELYNELININLEENYPQTPEEVIDIYLKTMKLIYGDMIFSRDLLREVLLIQRNLFSYELLSLNSEDVQFNALVSSVDTLLQNEIVLVENSVVQIENEMNRVVAELQEIYTNSDVLTRNVFLEQDELDKWRIIFWAIEGGEGLE